MMIAFMRSLHGIHAFICRTQPAERQRLCPAMGGSDGKIRQMLKPTAVK
jgi:hypothetical protein